MRPGAETHPARDPDAAADHPRYAAADASATVLTGHAYAFAEETVNASEL